MIDIKAFAHSVAEYEAEASPEDGPEDNGLKMLKVGNQPLSVGRNRRLGKFLD
jgi:hypothetical protein